MRMTPLRWGLLLGLAILGLAAVTLPPAQVEDPRRWRAPEQDAIDRTVAAAADVMRREMVRWVAVRAADAERTGPALPVRVTVLGGRAGALETLAGEAARQLWTMVPAGPAPLSLHVLVVRREGEALPGVPLSALPWSYSVPPDQTDGRTCRLLVPVNWEWLADKAPEEARRALLREVRSALGPCALWKAFGPPGPAIRDWLARVDYRVAAEGTWATRGRADLLTGWGPWGPADDVPPVLHEFLRRAFGEPNLQYTFGPAGARCLAGHGASCAEALTQVRPRRAGVSFTSLSWGRPNDALGLEAPAFLSDLVIAEGPERFARFWRSDAPVLEAFAAAFDTSAAAWTGRWMREQYGALEAGAPVEPLTALLAALASMAVVGAVAVELNRRTVT